MTTKENFEKTLEIIKQNENMGSVVFMTRFGLMACNLERFVRQSADGLLYDLDRDEATTLALGESGLERWVNDYATAKVIRYLIDELEKARRREPVGTCVTML